MVLLMIFALIAGAATALSPCALPVLPVAFSAGVTGGRRRPLGVATGLAVSFTFAVVALVYVIATLGLPDGLLRTFAIAVLLVFGLSLMVPRAAHRLEGWISRSTSGAAGRVSGAASGSAAGDGFWSGFVIGSGLGLVYAPCAGPILAGVITATASQDFSAGRLAVAAAYGVGSAITFFALMVGGRRLISPLARRSARLQVAMGAVMVLMAVGMFADLDLRFQTAIADGLPSYLTNPTGSLERSAAVRDDLARARGRRAGERTGRARDDRAAGDPSNLPRLGAAPEFVGTQRWFNTDDGKPLTLAGLRGKVVLVDFWTYTCINCIRTLPHIREWWSKYRADGLVIVGVHTPEFPFERSAGNVRDAISRNELTYPVAQDNDYATWDAYQNQFWPAKYLIDARGQVRYTHFGEGEYDTTERAIRSLLAEAGERPAGDESSGVADQTPGSAPQTPETYLGAARAAGWVNGPIEPGTRNFGPGSGNLPADRFRYVGRWRVADDSAQAAGAGAGIEARIRAQDVFLVLGSPGRAREVRVLLDGRPIAADDAGADVRGSRVRVRGQRLYRLVHLPRRGEHTLSLRFDPGVSGYAFTFG
jgi:cytochrome c biogenesis protein CcdA/thiol-disulfide isomerase/thioredoxin